MKNWFRTLAPSGAGNSQRSITVILTTLKSMFLASECAVERPNTPDPMMRTDLGSSEESMVKSGIEGDLSVLGVKI